MSGWHRGADGGPIGVGGTAPLGPECIEHLIEHLVDRVPGKRDERDERDEKDADSQGTANHSSNLEMCAVRRLAAAHTDYSVA